MTSKTDKRTAFTLIELLVVLAIISLLSSVVLASLSGAKESARDTRRVQDMQQVMTAIELYRNQHGYIPGRGGGCDTNNGRKFDQDWCVVDELETVMASVPTDPLADDSGFHYGYDPYHSNTSNKCDGGTAAALGFYGSETGIDDRDTTSGGDVQLDEAAWNRIICPS